MLCFVMAKCLKVEIFYWETRICDIYRIRTPWEAELAHTFDFDH